MRVALTLLAVLVPLIPIAIAVALTSGGTRLVLSDRPWGEPARGAGSWAEWARRARPVEVPVD